MMGGGWISYNSTPGARATSPRDGWSVIGIAFGEKFALIAKGSGDTEAFIFKGERDRAAYKCRVRTVGGCVDSSAAVGLNDKRGAGVVVCRARTVDGTGKSKP